MIHQYRQLKTNRLVYAIRVQQSNEEQVLEFLRETECPFECIDIPNSSWKLIIHRNEDDIVVKEGEWIVKPTKTDFFVSEPNIFDQCYEKIQ